MGVASFTYTHIQLPKFNLDWKATSISKQRPPLDKAIAFMDSLRSYRKAVNIFLQIHIFTTDGRVAALLLGPVKIMVAPLGSGCLSYYMNVNDASQTSQTGPSLDSSASAVKPVDKPPTGIYVKLQGL